MNLSICTVVVDLWFYLSTFSFAHQCIFRINAARFLNSNPQKILFQLFKISERLGKQKSHNYTLQRKNFAAYFIIDEKITFVF